MTGRTVDLSSWGDFYNASCVHNCDTVRNVRDNIQVMRNEKIGQLEIALKLLKEKAAVANRHSGLCIALKLLAEIAVVANPHWGLCIAPKLLAEIRAVANPHSGKYQARRAMNRFGSNSCMFGMPLRINHTCANLRLQFVEQV